MVVWPRPNARNNHRDKTRVLVPKFLAQASENLMVLRSYTTREIWCATHDDMEVSPVTLTLHLQTALTSTGISGAGVSVGGGWQFARCNYMSKIAYTATCAFCSYSHTFDMLYRTLTLSSMHRDSPGSRRPRRSHKNHSMATTLCKAKTLLGHTGSRVCFYSLVAQAHDVMSPRKVAAMRRPTWKTVTRWLAS